MSRIWWSACCVVLALSVYLAYTGHHVTLTELGKDAMERLWNRVDVSDFNPEWPCPSSQSDPGVGSCRLKGNVNDCSCDFRTVNRVNQEYLYPIISQLTHTPFFKYFKVNLWCDCPLWPDDGMCVLQACSVCECEDGEVPRPWIDEENNVHTPCNTSRQFKDGDDFIR